MILWCRIRTRHLCGRGLLDGKFSPSIPLQAADGSPGRRSHETPAVGTWGNGRGPGRRCLFFRMWQGGLLDLLLACESTEDQSTPTKRPMTFTREAFRVGAPLQVVEADETCAIPEWQRSSGSQPTRDATNSQQFFSSFFVNSSTTSHSPSSP
jgi:hypothetical protein